MCWQQAIHCSKNQLMKIFYCSFFILILSSFSHSLMATTCISQVTPFGEWSNPATWSCGEVPSDGNCIDTIIIEHEVYITSQQDLRACGPLVIIVKDVLRFQSGQKLRLPCGTQFHLEAGGSLVPEGGGGNSNILELCSDVLWRTSDGILTGPLVFDIELASFEAHYQTEKHQVNLDWSTKSETNNAFFTIERSVDGLNFQAIGEVEGAGTSSLSLYYNFVDKEPLLGDVYYRLKQTDFDGSYSYTEAIHLFIEEANMLYSYPNPTNEVLNIELHSNQSTTAHIALFSANGQLVKSLSRNLNKGIYKESLNLSSLDQGLYILKVSTKQEIYNQRIIIQH